MIESSYVGTALTLAQAYGPDIAEQALKLVMPPTTHLWLSQRDRCWHLGPRKGSGADTASSESFFSQRRRIEEQIEHVCGSRPLLNNQILSLGRNYEFQKNGVWKQPLICLLFSLICNATEPRLRT